MDDLAIARALHVLAVVHWIGGVTMVTLVLLPAIMRDVPANERMEQFERIEGRFAFQAQISTLLAGLAGFWMTWRLDLWDRFLDPSYWWMHAMVAIWALFSIVLYVAEPLFLHRWFHERATSDPDGTFRFVLRFHRILLTASLVTTGAAVMGSHGGL